MENEKKEAAPAEAPILKGLCPIARSEFAEWLEEQLTEVCVSEFKDNRRLPEAARIAKSLAKFDDAPEYAKRQRLLQSRLTDMLPEGLSATVSSMGSVTLWKDVGEGRSELLTTYSCKASRELPNDYVMGRPAPKAEADAWLARFDR